MLQRRVRRGLALTTVFLAVVCGPAAPALADIGDPDPGGGTATTSTTVDTTPTTEPAPDTTTTTATDPSTTTTTAPADNDSGATTTSTAPPGSTSTTGPGATTTSTSFPSSGGSGRSTTNTRPSSTSTTTQGPTTTTVPAPSPAGAVVSNDDPGGGGFGGDAGATTGVGPSGGSGRATHPSPTRTGKDAETTAEPAPPDPNWFDASGLGGLLGVGADASQVPAGATPDAAPAALESALPGRDHTASPSSAALLGLSVLILLALAGGAAYRWWDRRPGRYWPA